MELTTQEKHKLKIVLKPSVQKRWKEKLSIDDFQIESDYSNNYQLLSLESFEIPKGLSNQGKASISYHDKTKDGEQIQHIEFMFNQTEEQYYASKNIGADDFFIQTDILKTFRFLSISAIDFGVHKDEIKVKYVKVHSWNIFDRKIVVEITFVIDGAQSVLFAEYELKIDVLKLLVELIEFDPEYSHLTLDENLKLRPDNIKLSIVKAQKYFNDKEMKQLNTLVSEIQLFNIKVKYGKEVLNIFDKNSIGTFEASLKIRDRIFPNVLLSAKCDATIAVAKIKKMFRDFKSVDIIDGTLRDIELLDLFPQWDKILLNKFFEERGFKNFVRSQIKILSENIKVETNSALIKVILKNSPTKEVVFEQEKQFANSIIERFVNAGNNHGELIEILASEKLNGSPKLNILFLSDFNVKEEKCSVVVATPNHWDDKINGFNKKRAYKLRLNYNQKVDFEFEKDIEFKMSHAEYMFKKLDSSDISFEILRSKKPRYFQYLINRHIGQDDWITLDDFDENNIILSQEYKHWGFKIKKVEFHKIKLTTSNKIKVRFLIASDKLNEEKFLYDSVKIDNSKIVEVFENIDSSMISIKKKNVLLAYPQYKVSIDDFAIEAPFKIISGIFEGDATKSFIECEFTVKFLDDIKVIKKTIYYGDLVEDVANDEEAQEEFENIRFTDFDLDYDPDQEDYAIKPRIGIRYIKDNRVFIKLTDWHLKNRKGKVKVEVNVQFGSDIRSLAGVVKFNKILTKEEYKLVKFKKDNEE